jgi:hypothetical protein
MGERWMANINQSSLQHGSSEERKLVYQELCNSYRSIEIFRAQLLGLLPLLSGTGIFFLLNDIFANPKKEAFAEYYLGPIGIFGCAITLGLFIYELRGIRNCYRLIATGRTIEGEFCVRGQFSSYSRPILGFIGMRLAACTIYSTVLASWTFVALVPLKFPGTFWIVSLVFGISLVGSLSLVWRASA